VGDEGGRARRACLPSETRISQLRLRGRRLLEPSGQGGGRGLHRRELETRLAYIIEGRENVRFVVADLCDPYKTFAERFFPNARVADKCHVLRLLTPHVNRRRRLVTGDRRSAIIRPLLLRSRFTLDHTTRWAADHWLEQHAGLRELCAAKESLDAIYRTRGVDRANVALTARPTGSRPPSSPSFRPAAGDRVRRTYSPSCRRTRSTAVARRRLHGPRAYRPKRGSVRERPPRTLAATLARRRAHPGNGRSPPGDSPCGRARGRWPRRDAAPRSERTTNAVATRHRRPHRRYQTCSASFTNACARSRNSLRRVTIVRLETPQISAISV
jgi:hypothetical protein